MDNTLLINYVVPTAFIVLNSNCKTHRFNYWYCIVIMRKQNNSSIHKESEITRNFSPMVYFININWRTICTLNGEIYLKIGYYLILYLHIIVSIIIKWINSILIMIIAYYDITLQSTHILNEILLYNIIDILWHVILYLTYICLFPFRRGYKYNSLLTKW